MKGFWRISCNFWSINFGPMPLAMMAQPWHKEAKGFRPQRVRKGWGHIGRYYKKAC